MTRFTTAAVATIIALAASAGAHAQTGFYVTGSLGTAKARDAGIKNDPDTGNRVLAPGGTVDDIKRSPVIGVGVGYRFTPLFRGDLSLTLRNRVDVSGDDGSPFTSASGKNFLAAKGRNQAVFATGYVDLGSYLPDGFRWIQPYVGAGLGVSRTRLSGLSNRNSVGDGDDLIAVAQPSGGTSRGLAWQLATGLGFEVASGLTVDLGYRYVDLGSMKVSAGDYRYRNADGSVDVASRQNALKGDLRTHEIQIGLRYAF
jgi:opacity protein-like surface antigen